MNIAYDAAHCIFKLDTDHTSYVIAVIDEEGFLCHAYYGDKISDTDVAYLLRTGEHPFVPSRNNRDRSAGIFCGGRGLLPDRLLHGEPGIRLLRGSVEESERSAHHLRECDRQGKLPQPPHLCEGTPCRRALQDRGTGRRVPWGYPHARRNQRAGNLGRLPVPIDSYYNCG